MTTPNYNPSNVPAGLDEADVLALVEGATLPRERQPAAARALASDARFAGMVRAMRRDREGLRALAEERAPSGLVEAATAALQPVLERQMLLGLSEGEPVSDRPPVSLVMPRRRPNMAALRVAMAAGIALLVGGGVYTAVLMSGGTPPGPGPVGPIARNDATEQRPAPVAPERVASRTSTADAGREPEAGPAAMALNAAPAEGAGAMATEDAASPPAATLAATEPQEMHGPPVPGPMSAAEAVRLAAEGRLIVRVVAPDSRVDRVRLRLSSPPGRAGWHLHGDAPEALAAVVAPPALRPDRPLRSEPRVLTGDRPFGSAPDLAGPPAPAQEYAPPKRVFVVATRLDEGTLDGLRASLADAGGEVVFEEAAAPLPMPPGPVMTPATVLWWGQGPSAWNGWGAVPLVIEK